MSSHLDTLIEQARSNLAQNNLREALTLLQRAEQLAQNDPAMLPRINFEMARVYGQTSDEASALALVRKAIKLSPDIVSEIDDWQKELMASKKNSLARKVRKEVKPYLIELDTQKYLLGISPRIWIVGGSCCAGLILLLSLALLIPWSSLGLGTRRSQQTRFDVERIKSNVGQVILLIEILDTADLGKANIPIPVGTSFAVSKDGYMLSNKHVTSRYHEARDKKGMASISKEEIPDVKLLDAKLMVCFGSDASQRYEAKIVHECPYLDAVLLRIDKRCPHPLNTIPNEIYTGEKVFACGFPGKATDLIEALDTKKIFEAFAERIKEMQHQGKSDFYELIPSSAYEVSLTGGIVSAVREIDGIRWVQTDAAVNPGSSGGPLVTMDCRVIAINTLKHFDSETTNFSLAINQLAEELSPWVSFRRE